MDELDSADIARTGAESMDSELRPARPESVAAHVKSAYAAQAMKRKDHIVAGLLAIFLGIFGMHKFYLGYNNAAFIMLTASIVGSIVTLGLAGAVVWVIAIVEGIIYLTKRQDDFDTIYVQGQREWF